MDGEAEMRRGRRLWRLLGALIVGVVLGLVAGCSSESGCGDDYDCPAKERCNVESGSCEAAGTSSCDVDDDCPRADDRCEDNRCISP